MKKNSNFKIIAATLVSLFNLLAVFSACIAWFSAKRKVDENADGFEVVNYNGLLRRISLYSLDTTTESTYKYSTDSFLAYTIDSRTGSLKKESGNKESMGKYDQLDSPFHSVLYIFEFDTKIASLQDKISITAKTTTEEENSPLLGTTPLKEKGNSLTAITRFRYSEEWMETESHDFSSGTGMKGHQFFTLSTEGNQTQVKDYHQSIEIISKSVTGISRDTFYYEVIVEYDTEALEYLYNLNLGSSVLDNITEDNAIQFEQDWHFEIK